jgi:BsaWI restriction endonuclease type 2
MPHSTEDVLKIYTEICNRLRGKSKQLATDKQRLAIEETFTKLLTENANVEPQNLWRTLSSVHIQYKSGLSGLHDPEQLRLALSASQSWNKTSGHAFELFVKNGLNKQLENSGIEILLQKDLNRRIASIKNSANDMKIIKGWIDQSSFDLYALSSADQKIFGCIQAKSSIRDRVTRDREPSLAARKAYFWSIAVILDGGFLVLPKFQAMVNGGSSEYKHNGWHGAYVFGSIASVDRIHHLDRSWQPLCAHAMQAKQQFSDERQEFYTEWRAS